MPLSHRRKDLYGGAGRPSARNYRRADYSSDATSSESDEEGEEEEEGAWVSLKRSSYGEVYARACYVGGMMACEVLCWASNGAAGLWRGTRQIRRAASRWVVGRRISLMLLVACAVLYGPTISECYGKSEMAYYNDAVIASDRPCNELSSVYLHRLDCRSVAVSASKGYFAGVFMPAASCWLRQVALYRYLTLDFERSWAVVAILAVVACQAASHWVMSGGLAQLVTRLFRAEHQEGRERLRGYDRTEGVRWYRRGGSRGDGSRRVLLLTEA